MKESNRRTDFDDVVTEVPSSLKTSVWRMKVDCPRRRVAGGIILNKYLTHILLVKSNISGKWGIPKGGIENDESDIEGAIREIYEETGIKIESPLIEPMAPCIIYRGAHIFLFCYKKEEDISLMNPRPLDSVEIAECAWVPLDDLLNNNLCTMFNDLSIIDNYENMSIEMSPPDKLPVISTEFGPIHRITTMLKDLIVERLDTIKRKITINMDNYEVIDGKIIINNSLASILEDARQNSVDYINMLHTVQVRFPTVFYLPELIRIIK